MERRLNCYNYIFSTCHSGSRCPFGHVIVQNKDEYHRNYEMNVDGTRDKTSPRGNFHIDIWKQNIGSDTDKMFKKKRSKALDDNACSFLHCATCKNIKCEPKNLALLLRKSNEPFVCRDCQNKNRNSNEMDDGLGFFDKLGVYNM